MKTYFPNEEVLCIDEVTIDVDSCWKLFFDRAMNMKGVGIGAFLISKLGNIFNNNIILILLYQQHDRIWSLHFRTEASYGYGIQ